MPSFSVAEIVVKKLATKLTTNDINIYYNDSLLVNSRVGAFIYNAFA